MLIQSGRLLLEHLLRCWGFLLSYYGIYLETSGGMLVIACRHCLNSIPSRLRFNSITLSSMISFFSLLRVAPLTLILFIQRKLLEHLFNAIQNVFVVPKPRDMHSCLVSAFASLSALALPLGIQPRAKVPKHPFNLCILNQVGWFLAKPVPHIFASSTDRQELLNHVVVLGLA